MKSNRPALEADATQVIKDLLGGKKTGRGVCAEYHVGWNVYVDVIYRQLTSAELAQVTSLGHARAWTPSARALSVATRRQRGWTAAKRPALPREPDPEVNVQPPWWMCSGCGHTVQALIPGRCPKCSSAAWERLKGKP